MLIKSIKLKDFRSFQGEHSFDFTDKAQGLYYLSGENGSGKSTLFESLHWLLFGSTSRGLKARDIHSWGHSGSTWGELILTLDQDYTIERQWSPNKLRLNGRDIEQAELNALLPLTSETFQTAIYVSQFSDMFFDLKPTARLDLISNILQLDYWIECSNRANKEKTTLLSQQTEQQKKLEFINGRMDQLISSADTYESKASTFDQEKDQKITALTKVLEDHVKTIKELLLKKSRAVATDDMQKELTKLQTKLSRVSKDSLKLEEKSTLQTAAIQDLNKEIQTHNSGIQSFQIEAAPYRKALQKFNALQDECTACGQEISKAYKNKQIKETNLQLTRIDHDIALINTEIDKIKTEIKAKTAEQTNTLRELSIKNTDFETIKTEQLTITNKITRLEQEQNLILTQIKNAETLADNQRKLIVEWEVKKNPYELELETCVDQLETIDVEKNALIEKISELSNMVSGTEYWVKTFKEVRLYVAEEILTNLEIRVNNYINDLGLEGWTIKFDVEKENRSGGVSKGFHILINSPLSDDGVPWESWSGGEAQRLRLAGTLGLSDLILQSLGLKSNLLILDEPTKHLNEDGINCLLELLYTKASQDNKQIWISDHHIVDFGGFAEILEVTKNQEGSHLSFT